MNKLRKSTIRRRGSVAVLLCILTLPLLALLALSVDYGFLLFIRTDLQRSADLAALAGVRDLIPDENGNQDVDQVRETVREYVQENLGDAFVVRDEDIQIGRFDPATIYDSVSIQGDGTFDTVQVTLRRDDLANSSVSMYFARLFGRNVSEISVRSAAILQKARYLGPGTSVLPIAMDQTAWDSLSTSDSATVFGDGKIEDEYGNEVPGNFGTLDIGAQSNGTSELNDQIENGISQEDLNSLEDQGAISSSEHIDSNQQMWLNGDTGLSAGMKHSIDANVGTTRLIPIVSQSRGHGGNLEYRIIGWGMVKLADSNWQGNKDTYIRVQKVYAFDAHLKPNPDITDVTNVIEGAYTSPVLVQ